MATGFWIEWEKGLPGKPEIGRIARELGVTRLHAAAACMEVWSWAEEQTEDGRIDATLADVSEAVRLPGIAEAMAVAGWLVEECGVVTLPNWGRHNGRPARRRQLNALRMRAERAEQRAQNPHACAKHVR